MDIDCPVQTLIYTGRVSCYPSEEQVATTTNSNPSMLDYSNPVRDPDEEVCNTYQCRILHDISLDNYFIRNHYFIYHKFFILYAIHILESGAVVCSCLCILTVVVL
jgi:hypothetical protein